MAKVTMRVDGLRELEKSLEELGRSVSRRVVRKVLIAAAEPIAEAGKAGAPVETGALAESYGVGTKLTRRQASLNRKSGSPSAVEVHAGVNNPAGVQTEFGNEHQVAEPHLRPAWDAGHGKALEDIKFGLGKEIDKAAKRAAKRAAKAAAKKAR